MKARTTDFSLMVEGVEGYCPAGEACAKLMDERPEK
jgi:hypothetical protein